MSAKRGSTGPNRLISTSSLAVALCLLFLPFIGVSCESGMGTINAEISGWDMAVGGAPSVSRTGIFGSTAPDISVAPGGRVLDDGDVRIQPLMMLAVLAMLSGLLIGVILRNARVRALGVGIAAGLAALLVTINQIDVTSDLVAQLRTGASRMTGDPADMVGSRFGYWLTLGALVITMTFHIRYLTPGRRGAALVGRDPYPPSPTIMPPPYAQPSWRPPDNDPRPGPPPPGPPPPGPAPHSDA